MASLIAFPAPLVSTKLALQDHVALAKLATIRSLERAAALHATQARMRAQADRGLVASALQESSSLVLASLAV